MLRSRDRACACSGALDLPRGLFGVAIGFFFADRRASRFPRHRSPSYPLSLVLVVLWRALDLHHRIEFRVRLEKLPPVDYYCYYYHCAEQGPRHDSHVLAVAVGDAAIGPVMGD